MAGGNATRTLRALCLVALTMALSACGGGNVTTSGGNSAPGSSASGAPVTPTAVPAGGTPALPTATTLTVSTLAGTGNPAADGTGAAARFYAPDGVVSDGLNLYVADTWNHTIRKIVIATGAVTTLAGTAGVAGVADGIGAAAAFKLPSGIAIDATNTNLYVADAGNGKIRRIVIATGAVSSVTGLPNVASMPGALDGAAATATFTNPRGIATDGVNLYVADAGNHKIRKVALASAVVSSVTGVANTASAIGAADGAASAATFSSPCAIVIDSKNAFLYVADTGNNNIRQVVISTGAVTSVTGKASTASGAGATDGPGAQAQFNAPSGMAADANNLYVVDWGNRKIRQVVISSGATSSLTGTAGAAMPAGYADGAAATATFGAPYGIAVAGGNLYVTDANGNTVRMIARGTVTTLAGSGRLNTGADGAGAAARFAAPGDAVSDGVNLYVADTSNNTVRKIVIATGAVTTLAGTAGIAGAADGTGSAATFNLPAAIATDGVSLYIADTGNNKIRKITPAAGSLSAITRANAIVTSLTGAANTARTAGAVDGPAGVATFSAPAGIASDGASLYIADQGNNKIRKLVLATATVTSLTGVANVSVVAGAADGAAATAAFNRPAGLILDSAKTNLYVADTGNNKIRRVTLATGAVASFTGAANTAGAAGAADGAAGSATFNHPVGIATDGGNLYIADCNNSKIRLIALGSGAVSSFTGTAGTPGVAGYADGAPAAAAFNLPQGLTYAGATLYVADTGSGTLRAIR